MIVAVSSSMTSQVSPRCSESLISLSDVASKYSRSSSHARLRKDARGWESLTPAMRIGIRPPGPGVKRLTAVFAMNPRGAIMQRARRQPQRAIRASGVGGYRTVLIVPRHRPLAVLRNVSRSIQTAPALSDEALPLFFRPRQRLLTCRQDAGVEQ